jgi:serine/threonine protein kinase, bacterial
MPLAEGQLIAGYTILRSIGAGGMGEVYLAQHPRLPRQDALKVLPASVSADQEYRQRFIREADIAATLWHPHIVEVHDRGEFEDQLWIAMDYVEGTDAGAMLSEQYPRGMPPDEVVRIITAVASALDHAHQRQLLHRDVKPANILMANPDTDEERVMLADFGIARYIQDATGLTGTNMTVGTVAYSAPEQLMGTEIDGRADQYALAATAFHLLTGKPPFQHTNPAAVISEHLTSAPPEIGALHPELTGLGPVLSKALAKSPADRYERCIDFAHALQHRLGQGGGPSNSEATMLASVVAPAVSGPRHSKQSPVPPSRKKVLRPILAVVAVIAVAAVAFVLFERTRSHPTSEAKPSAPAPTPAQSPSPTPGTPALPVVAVGANCATLGAAGITTNGAPAYCAHLPTTDGTIWSLYPGEVSSPTLTAGPDDETYAPETEGPVLVCMEQTGQSRLECHQGVVQANAPTPTTSTTAPS